MILRDLLRQKQDLEEKLAFELEVMLTKRGFRWKTR
jgi:hypothetical protein